MYIPAGCRETKIVCYDISLWIQPCLLKKYLGYKFNGQVPSQTVFGSIGYIYIYILHVATVGLSSGKFSLLTLCHGQMMWQMNVSYPLVNCYIAIENGPDDIVSFPMKNGGSFHSLLLKIAIYSWFTY